MKNQLEEIQDQNNKHIAELRKDYETIIELEILK